ncbi:metalloregulator ArsR/SmtB family transcription factor [Actinotalea sp.]|uniref:ArsR/SmtB family transcription factor n=1 Tax=Actinotalea sp. TaxID=1872145 RepID=UPI002C42F8E8|nr:metalloregulator ArsR/SmtB family transcription factor [Actinotalea sp.]HQY32928.1 metalloregulator ArsR/SmtB family transcription factor [Actinotalea sp.]HRA50317.1 metalloregulator ArsR/SmtB family transcription factor [Actinotalea sp.]
MTELTLTPRPAGTPHDGTPHDEAPADGAGGVLACCTPLTRRALSGTEATAVAQVLKALADPARVRLVSLVAAHEGGTACVCDLVEPLGLSQPTVSHHLKVLVRAGLLHREQRGVWAHYSVVPGALDDLARVLTSTGRG